MKDRCERDLNEITGKIQISVHMNNRVRINLEIITTRNFERRGNIQSVMDFKIKKIAIIPIIFESFPKSQATHFFKDSSKSSYEMKSRCVIAAAIFITFKTVINCMVNFVTTFMCFSCFEIIYNIKLTSLSTNQLTVKKDFVPSQIGNKYGNKYGIKTIWTIFVKDSFQSIFLNR